jgi:hypothetical protein
LIPAEAIVVDVYEHRNRGKFLAFAYDLQRCACGAQRALIPMRLRMSRHPFADMGRYLLAAGFNRDAIIAMIHDAHGPVALRSTLADAAMIRVTDSRFGTPIFAAHRQKVKQQPRREAESRPAVPGQKTHQRLLLHPPAKKAA